MGDGYGKRGRDLFDVVTLVLERCGAGINRKIGQCVNVHGKEENSSQVSNLSIQGII